MWVSRPPVSASHFPSQNSTSRCAPIRCGLAASNWLGPGLEQYVESDETGGMDRMRWRTSCPNDCSCSRTCKGQRVENADDNMLYSPLAVSLNISCPHICATIEEMGAVDHEAENKSLPPISNVRCDGHADSDRSHKSYPCIQLLSSCKLMDDRASRLVPKLPSCKASRLWTEQVVGAFLVFSASMNVRCRLRG